MNDNRPDVSGSPPAAPSTGAAATTPPRPQDPLGQALGACSLLSSIAVRTVRDYESLATAVRRYFDVLDNGNVLQYEDALTSAENRLRGLVFAPRPEG